jgi:hypothetical protein
LPAAEEPFLLPAEENQLQVVRRSMFGQHVRDFQ